ncbi:MAG: DUF2306 domain-containing protein [Asticcacaulis sp.]|nr:DUF2306 domain-containing protein [Asticcacaulis sp.]
MNNFFQAFAHPHAPDLALLAAAPLVIQIHLAAAVAAFTVATIQIFGPKGTLPHRTLGWIWVVFMMTVAISSFFIQIINPHGFSLIHILSVVTLIGVPILVLAARRHDVKRHRRIALNLYIGALLVAGIFTFMPGRLMWRMFFG